MTIVTARVVRETVTSETNAPAGYRVLMNGRNPPSRHRAVVTVSRDELQQALTRWFYFVERCAGN